MADIEIQNAEKLLLWIPDTGTCVYTACKIAMKAFLPDDFDVELLRDMSGDWPEEVQGLIAAIHELQLIPRWNSAASGPPVFHRQPVVRPIAVPVVSCFLGRGGCHLTSDLEAEECPALPAPCRHFGLLHLRLRTGAQRPGNPFGDRRRCGPVRGPCEVRSCP